MSGCYEGWTLEWRDWVLVGTGPDGQQASLGEVWTDSTGAHYELLDPIGGDRFHTAKAANRPTAQRIATNLARRVGATFLPSAPALAAGPVSHTGSVARPTDVAAQPEAGAFGGEASPGASAPQAGPPSAREPETVGANPAPVTGSSHAPLPAGDALSPAVGTPGMHRQGDVSGVRVGPWVQSGFRTARHLGIHLLAAAVYEGDPAVYDSTPASFGWYVYTRAGVHTGRALIVGNAATLAEAQALVDTQLLAQGLEVPDPVVVPEPLAADALRPSGLLAAPSCDSCGDSPDWCLACDGAAPHMPGDVLAERWEERYHEAQARIAELEAEVARLAPQPDPQGGEGDCWAELLAHVGPWHPAAAMGAERRALGIARYGQPLRRGDGRDSARDLREELLDGAVYAWREGLTVLAVHLINLAAEPGRGDQVIAAHHAARVERDALRARIAELDPHGLFDLATQAQARIAELEEAVQELATARADLAIVDQILAPICGPTIPDDRRVRLGVLLARAPRWT